MDLDAIANEYEQNGKLSDRAITSLREHLRREDPFDAISLAGDTAALQLAPEIARHLLASRIYEVFRDESADMATRTSAYDGIEAAVGISPFERIPGYRDLDLERDDWYDTVEEFRQLYLR
jgi:hypothetical protein